jgi:pyrimidine operon attenuation protein/uracil phosphoribosyltransferase
MHGNYVALPSAEILIEKLILALKPYFPSNLPPADQPVIIGIETGGYWIADAIHKAIDPGTNLGRLNINFYRDDFTKIGLHPTVKPSSLPTDIDGKTIILVDDVLHSGRTIRAAMNEIFDYGRPKRIILAILIDRGEREIPIQADCVAETIQLQPGDHIKLDGPQPLQLTIKSIVDHAS